MRVYRVQEYGVLGFGFNKELRVQFCFFFCCAGLDFKDTSTYMFVPGYLEHPTLTLHPKT